MLSEYKIPRGTYDILPDADYKWQYIKENFRKVARNYNFREIVTPIFEKAEIFERSIGDTTDIVEKEMYKFSDKKGRNYVLRPEGTAPVVRAFVENHLYYKNNSSKLFYLGPMFRYDRPQKGRYRQFYQYGVEYFGKNNPYIDAEVISLAYRFLKNLGLNNIIIELNSIGCPNCNKEYNKALKTYFKKYKNKLCKNCLRRLGKNPKRVLDCKVPFCKEIASNAPSILDYLDKDCKSHFEKVKSFLKELKIPFKINPKIVRGLDYYNQTAFEILNNNLGAQNALLGGGRYNSLVQEFGGNDIPGFGFAGGMERLILTLEQENLFPKPKPQPFIFLVVIGAKAKSEGIKLTSQIRQKGFSCEFLYQKTSLNAQMKAANKSNAPFVLILGENELKSKEIVIKIMKTGKQNKIPLINLYERLEQYKSDYL